MECAALAACAAYRGKVFAQILLLPIHFTIYLTNSGRGEKKAAIRRSSWESKRRRGYEGRVMSAGELLFGGLLAVNAAAFFLYGLDKWKAVHGRRRIRERTLLFIAAAGGSAGAFLAMRFFTIRRAMLYFNSACPSFSFAGSFRFFPLEIVRADLTIFMIICTIQKILRAVMKTVCVSARQREPSAGERRGGRRGRITSELQGGNALTGHR